MNVARVIDTSIWEFEVQLTFEEVRSRLQVELSRGQSLRAPRTGRSIHAAVLEGHMQVVAACRGESELGCQNPEVGAADLVAVTLPQVVELRHDEWRRLDQPSIVWIVAQTSIRSERIVRLL